MSEVPGIKESIGQGPAVSEVKLTRAVHLCDAGSDRCYAATIVHVWSTIMINVVAFTHDGERFSRTSVPFDYGNPNYKITSWHWPRECPDER